MIRQLFQAARLAQLARPISSASLNTPIAQLSIGCLPVRYTYRSIFQERTDQKRPQKQRLFSKSTRSFSQTSAVRFTSSAIQNSSPFRLSADKHTPYPFPEDDPYSQYPPKRQWPPDMSKLSPKHQFRLERKYRRRAALKYARPKFIKAVTLAQWIIIGCES